MISPDVVSRKNTTWAIVDKIGLGRDLCLFTITQGPSGSRFTPAAFLGWFLQLARVRGAASWMLLSSHQGPRVRIPRWSCLHTPLGAFRSEKLLGCGFRYTLKVAFCTMKFRIQEFKVCSEPSWVSARSSRLPFWSLSHTGKSGACTACLFGYFLVDVIFLNKFSFPSCSDW